MLRQIEELEAADAKRREVEEMMAQVAMQAGSSSPTLPLTLSLPLTRPHHPSPHPHPTLTPNPSVAMQAGSSSGIMGPGY